MDERWRLAKKEQALRTRAAMIQAMRLFFVTCDFLEVETPLRVPEIAPEAHIDAISSENEFLQTSPELCMKRLLAAGYSRLFQISKCFRRGERGGRHLPEFTMLNLVEMGLPEKDCQKRIKELACLVMEAAEINDYAFETVGSEVYGETFDIVYNKIEIGSAAMGPHPLDQAWGITVPWVGIGFGLERILAVKNGLNSVQKAGHSLSYMDGIRLNIQ